ncbi:MAG: hypothetical protein ACT4NY_23155 [Pseudonocardiales bacterium]
MLVKEILLDSEGSRSGLDAPTYTLDASTYAGFAGIMTGFAFAGLVVYLTRPKPRQEKSENEHPTAVEVVTALFYAMSSLAICTFLYSSLAGEPDHSDRALMAGLTYGPALGISVLSLFYSMTLMMFEHEVTQKSAQSAFRVVVIIGPIVVLGFLTSHSYLVSQAVCDRSDRTLIASCHTYDSLYIGASLFVPLAAMLGVVFLPSRAVIAKFLPAGIKNFRDRSTFTKRTRPSEYAFGIASLATVASVIITIQDSDTVIPNRFEHYTLAFGSFLLIIFTFLSGCVLKKMVPPPEADPTAPEASPSTPEARTAPDAAG